MVWWRQPCGRGAVRTGAQQIRWLHINNVVYMIRSMQGALLLLHVCVSLAYSLVDLSMYGKASSGRESLTHHGKFADRFAVFCVVVFFVFFYDCVCGFFFFAFFVCFLSSPALARFPAFLFHDF